MRRISSITTLLLAGATWLSAQEGGGLPEPAAGWKWANFVLLVVGLGYLIAKTLPPLFKSRTEEIQNGIAEARAIKQDADKRAAEVDARTATLGADIEHFRVEAKAEMQQEGERIRQETAAQIARLENQAQQEIEVSGKIARRELKSYAAKLSLDLAEQRIAEASKKLRDEPLIISLQGMLHAHRNQVDAALDCVRRSLDMPLSFGHAHHTFYQVACVYALLGETDKAMAWLERSADTGNPCGPFFRIDPHLERMRQHPGFQRLVASLEREYSDLRINVM